MLSLPLTLLVRLLVRRMLRGDVDALLLFFADDAELTFPGRSSFGGTFRGKAAVRAWLQRFVSMKPVYIVREVTVSGPLWAMRVNYHVSDRIGEHYANEAIVQLHFRWLKARRMRVYLDTEAVSAWEHAHPEETARDLTVAAAR